MNRGEILHLAALLAVAVLARYVLFQYVGVWGDAGFYTYDALLINSGQTPFVDFIGRSPLFMYLYAFVASIFGNAIETLRVFIAFWWLLSAVPVYYIARKIYNHTAALVAVAVLELSPYMLVYGYWANTQSVAAFAAITGIAVLMWKRSWTVYVLSGLLFGAAFLSRRSVITIMGAIALWMGYTAIVNHRHELWSALQRRFIQGVAFLGGVGISLTLMYAWMADGDLSLTIALAKTHVWGLIQSNGRGGFAMVTDVAVPTVQNSIDHGRIPIFNDIFQMVGAWTARTFAKTTLVTLPIVAPLLIYFRDWSDRYFSDRTRDYTLGILIALAIYGAVVAFAAGYWLRPLAVGSLVVFGVIVFRAPVIDRDVLYNNHMMLLLFGMGMLSLGYLIRNRIIHTYYFSDFMPLLSIVVGILYVELWQVTTNE